MNKQTFVIKQGCVSYTKTHSYKSPNLFSEKGRVSEHSTPKCATTNRTCENSSQEPRTKPSPSASTDARQCSSLEISSVTSTNPNQESSRMVNQSPNLRSNQAGHAKPQGLQYHEDQSDFVTSKPKPTKADMARGKGTKPARQKVQRKSRRQKKRDENQSTLTNWLTAHHNSGRTDVAMVDDILRNDKNPCKW